MRKAIRTWLRCCLCTAALLLPGAATGGPRPADVGAGSREMRQAVRAIRTLLDDRRFPEAEAQARTLLAALEAVPDSAASLEYYEATDLLVEALRRRGDADLQTVRLLAERTLAWKDQHLDARHPSLAPSLKNLSEIQQRSGEYDEALRLAQRALTIVEATPGVPPAVLEKYVRGVGNARYHLGDYQAARMQYERSLQLIEGAFGRDHHEVAGVLYNLALVRDAIGDFSAAAELYRRALDLKVRALGESDPEVAFYREGLALLLEETGDVVGAYRESDRALRILIARRGPEHLDVAALQNNIGILLRNMGDYEEATDLLSRSLTTRERLLPPDHIDLAQSYHNLGSVRLRRREFAEAERLLSQGLAIRRAVLKDPAHLQIATSLQTLATLYSEKRDFDRARDHFLQALEIYDRRLEEPHPDQAYCLGGLAAISESEGDLQAAAAYSDRALAIRRSTLGPDHPLSANDLFRLAVIRSRTREPEAALDKALEAEEVSRRHLLLTVRALPERQAIAHASIRPPALDLAISILAGAGNPRAARRVWDALIRSRALVLDQIALRNHLLAMDRDPALRGLSERWAAASRTSAHLHLTGPRGETAERYRSLLLHARREAEEIERTLGDQSRLIRSDLDRAGVGLDLVAGALQPGDLLVAYVRFKGPSGTPFYAAFSLGQGEAATRFVDLGSAEEIDRLIEAWRKAVRRPPAVDGRDRRAADPDLLAAGRALRRRVWDPAVGRGVSPARVLVVPDGGLYAASFAALPRDAGGYLVEDLSLIHYLSAERDLVERRQGVPAGRGLLAIGNPDFGRPAGAGASLARAETDSGSGAATRAGCGGPADWTFDPLPGADQEVREVAALWRARPSSDTEAKVLTGPRATESAFKRLAPGRRVLHLATHGYFLGADCAGAGPIAVRGIGGLSPASGVPSAPQPVDRPLHLSGLALAGANRAWGVSADPEDGVLTAEEIATLDLSGVEWVTLSACDTGTGEVRAGEGVFGLRRAFHLAGADALVMSLWTVEDSAAREFMGALIRSRAVEARSPAGSVRQAALEFIAARRREGRTDHPFYWGAWISEGAAR